VQIRRLSFGVPEQWLIDRHAELSGESNETYAARCLGKTRTVAVTRSLSD
jgi:hypothetical protein